MADFILIMVLLLILGVAAGYILRAKKRGVHCICCPDAGHCAHMKTQTCSGNCSGCSGCASHHV